MDSSRSDPSTPSTEIAYARLFTLAAHELRTPVSVVGGYLRMLQRGDTSSLSEGQQRIIDEAAKACDRLTALVAELSDLGKLDAGVAAINHAPLDLFSLAEQAAADVVQDLSDDRISLQGLGAGGSIEGDAPRVRAAFATLIRTVLRERPSEQAITIERRLTGTGSERSAIILIGAAADVSTALDASREPIDEGRGGLGLALPIARRVIELHGGELWSASSPSAKPGRGVFVVSIQVLGT